ncbi:hypothetical protein [Thermobifida cellulosilytica]|uniref:Uncharacterized protein n=1 Tax=Thermobifida cellulosilytica TB100 TaxID=665004 RepID=A0A147KK28_THECS|nr:hypothetical protein [Thermobifida cellulosilytica]KUP97589.1 hypothetical protein AC529_05885 [Thermobifida cellulosilytica TB100]
MPATFTLSNPTDTDRTQDARLAALIRQLAGVRPDILAPVAPPPRPAPRPAERPLRKARHYPVDPETLDRIAYLRAVACGTHRPGQYWPAHATRDYYARKLRTPLRRRLSDAVRAAAPVASPALAFAAGCLSALLGTALLG